MKHTPGPWHVKIFGGQSYIQSCGQVEAATWIASLCPGSGKESDAALLAAAPDLLKELRMLLLQTNCSCMQKCEDDELDALVHYWDSTCARCVMAKAAIAKAEGK